MKLRRKYGLSMDDASVETTGMNEKKGLFRFCMRNEILRRSEKIETRSKKHDFSDRNSPVYVIQ